MLRFEDLKYLTADMVRLLMKEVSNDKLGLALRAADKELIEHFKSNMSSNNQKDLDDVLNGKPQPASKVQEAQDEILDIVRAKQATGEIVIDKSGSETYV
jgi:flagellar motor switch protein FliG